MVNFEKAEYVDAVLLFSSSRGCPIQDKYRLLSVRHYLEPSQECFTYLPKVN